MPSRTATAGNGTSSRKGISTPVAAAPGKRTTNSPIPIEPLLRWFLANARDLPWRRTLDPYAIWISEIMLQQTQVKSVIPYFNRWLAELPNPAALANAPQQRVLKLWEGLGYYSRARNLQNAAKQIVDRHDGKLPRNFDDILALPGVGRYTAGAIASIAFDQPRPILDGNVVRVLCRLFAIRDNPRDKAANARLWNLAEQLVNASVGFALPRHRALKFSGPCSVLNQALMELGATTCTPRSPACLLCPFRANCAAFRLKLTDQLPNLAKRTAVTERRFHTFIVRRGKQFLVNQRPERVVNAHLWEFPNIELNGSATSADSARKLFGSIAEEPRSFGVLRHTITRYRITQEVFAIKAHHHKTPKDGTHAWQTLEELRRLPFSSAHKKLLSKLSLED